MDRPLQRIPRRDRTFSDTAKAVATNAMAAASIVGIAVAVVGIHKANEIRHQAQAFVRARNLERIRKSGARHRAKLTRRILRGL